MFTAILLAAALGQTDYALAPPVPIHDYAFAPLRSEHLAAIAAIRPAKKRTAPTPAKCPGGRCVANPQPQAIEPKSVLIWHGEATSEPAPPSTRRTSWRFLQRFRR
jgi:hypothetical protein